MPAPGPPPQAPPTEHSTATRASPEAQHEANTRQRRTILKGRSQSTAPHGSALHRGSNRGYYDADQGVIWHQDRSGHYWSSNARDPRHDRRDDLRHRDAQQGNWWDDRDWWSHHRPHRNWEWNRDRDAWQSTRHDSPAHSPAPPPEQVHGNVRQQGWASSLLIDGPVRHNHGRPFHVGARGQYLFGIACTGNAIITMHRATTQSET